MANAPGSESAPPAISSIRTTLSGTLTATPNLTDLAGQERACEQAQTVATDSPEAIAPLVPPLLEVIDQSVSSREFTSAELMLGGRHYIHRSSRLALEALSWCPPDTLLTEAAAAGWEERDVVATITRQLKRAPEDDLEWTRNALALLESLAWQVPELIPVETVVDLLPHLTAVRETLSLPTLRLLCVITRRDPNEAVAETIQDVCQTLQADDDYQRRLYADALLACLDADRDAFVTEELTGERPPASELQAEIPSLGVNQQFAAVSVLGCLLIADGRTIEPVSETVTRFRTAPRIEREPLAETIGAVAAVDAATERGTGTALARTAVAETPRTLFELTHLIGTAHRAVAPEEPVAKQVAEYGQTHAPRSRIGTAVAAGAVTCARVDQDTTIETLRRIVNASQGYQRSTAADALGMVVAATATDPPAAQAPLVQAIRSAPEIGTEALFDAGALGQLVAVERDGGADGRSGVEQLVDRAYESSIGSQAEGPTQIGADMQALGILVVQDDRSLPTPLPALCERVRSQTDEQRGAAAILVGCAYAVFEKRSEDDPLTTLATDIQERAAGGKRTIIARALGKALLEADRVPTDPVPTYIADILTTEGTGLFADDLPSETRRALWTILGEVSAPLLGTPHELLERSADLVYMSYGTEQKAHRTVWSHLWTARAQDNDELRTLKGLRERYGNHPVGQGAVALLRESTVEFDRTGPKELGRIVYGSDDAALQRTAGELLAGLVTSDRLPTADVLPAAAPMTVSDRRDDIVTYLRERSGNLRALQQMFQLLATVRRDKPALLEDVPGQVQEYLPAETPPPAVRLAAVDLLTAGGSVSGQRD